MTGVKEGALSRGPPWFLQNLQFYPPLNKWVSAATQEGLYALGGLLQDTGRAACKTQPLLVRCPQEAERWREESQKERRGLEPVSVVLAPGFGACVPSGSLCEQRKPGN